MKSATPSSSIAPARSDNRLRSVLRARARGGASSDPALELVRRTLAQHLGIETDEIYETQDLEEGLGLDPLDLVLVALRLEELGEVEFPVAELERATTVADLTMMVRTWWASSCEATLGRARSGAYLRAVWPTRSTLVG